MKISYNNSNTKTKISLINFSDRNYKKSQIYNTKSAITIGGFYKVFSYSPKDIDKEFYLKNKNILDQPKGAGFWLWKPYFIKKTLEKLNEGDYLFYSDSGSHFLESIDSLMSSIDLNLNVITFELQGLERKWTKRDAFVLMDCDFDEITNTKQRLCTFILLKKSDFSLNFVEEWLTYAQDERIITDQEGYCKKTNYDGFFAHRHDQSIFSILAKKYYLAAYRDPSQFGNNFKYLYPNSTYNQLILSTRQKDLSLFRKIKKIIKKNRSISKLYYIIKINLFNK